MTYSKSPVSHPRSSLKANVLHDAGACIVPGRGASTRPCRANTFQDVGCALGPVIVHAEYTDC